MTSIDMSMCMHDQVYAAATLVSRMDGKCESMNGAFRLAIICIAANMV